MADGQPQPAQVAGQVAFPAEEASRECQQDVSAGLWGPERASDSTLHATPTWEPSSIRSDHTPQARAVQRPGQPRLPTARLEQGWQPSEPTGGGEPPGGCAGHTSAPPALSLEKLTVLERT